MHKDNSNAMLRLKSIIDFLERVFSICQLTVNEL